MWFEPIQLYVLITTEVYVRVMPVLQLQVETSSYERFTYRLQSISSNSALHCGAGACTVGPFWQCLACALAICRVASGHRVVPGRRGGELSPALCICARPLLSRIAVPCPSHAQPSVLSAVPCMCTRFFRVASQQHIASGPGMRLPPPVPSCNTCHTRACLHPKALRRTRRRG